MIGPRAEEEGIALIEVVVSLLLVVTVGVPLLARVGGEARLLVQRIDQEETARAAEHALAAYAALDRTALEQRLGRRSVGRFEILVDRPTPALFRIVVVEPRTEDRSLTATFLYRRAP